MESREVQGRKSKLINLIDCLLYLGCYVADAQINDGHTNRSIVSTNKNGFVVFETGKCEKTLPSSGKKENP